MMEEFMGVFIPLFIGAVGNGFEEEIDAFTLWL